MSDFKNDFWDWAEAIKDWLFLVCVFALIMACLYWGGCHE